MDTSLTGQGFIFTLAVLETVLVVSLLSRMSRRWKWHILPLVLVVSALVSFSLRYPLERIARAPGEVPDGFGLMVLPLVFGIGFLLALVLQHVNWWRHDRRHRHAPEPFTRRRHGWRTYGLSLATAIGGILLSATFVNGYYRLYPTFGSVVGRDTTTGATHTGQRYSAAGYTPRTDTTEASLFPDRQDKTGGTVRQVTIPAPLSRFKSEPALLYSPPIAASNSVSLPIIVLMPGTPGLPHDWFNGGQLRQTTDAFAAAHDGISPYVLVVDANGSATGDTECVDSKLGNVETFLTKDVPAYINATLDVPDEATSRAIGGLSLGGTCGIMTALRHPDVYRYFLDFAGDSGPSLGNQQQTIDTLFNGSRAEFEAHLPGNLMEQGKKAGVGGYFTNATHDDPGALIGTRSLATAARKAGLDMVYQTVPGHHSYGAWQQNYRDALPWISNRLGATGCTGNCQ